MKKILLTIILLLPIITFAETNYNTVFDKKIVGSYDTTIDNESSYILTTDSYMYRIDKLSGEIKQLQTYGNTAEWYNYDKSNFTFSNKESSNYLIRINETVLLTDNKLNIINSTENFYGYLDEIIIENNHFISAWTETNYDVDPYETSLYANIYDSEFNLIKEISILAPSSEYSYDPVTHYFYITNEDYSHIGYKINDNLEFEQIEVSRYINYEYNILYQYDENGDEIPKVDIEGAYIIDVARINNQYYVLYSLSNGKIFIALYDENLNLIKKSNDFSKAFQGASDIYLYHYNFSPELYLSVEYDDPKGQWIYEDYKIESNLELTKLHFMDIAKSNDWWSEGELSEKFYYPDLNSLLLSYDIAEYLESKAYYDILDVKEIDNKYYYLILVGDEEGENALLTSYLYVYNKDNTLYKKIKLFEKTETNVTELENNIENGHIYGTLLKIDNKIVTSTCYDSTKTTTITLDNELNIIDNIPSLYKDNAFLLYTIMDQGNILYLYNTRTNVYGTTLNPISGNRRPDNEIYYLTFIKEKLNITNNSTNNIITLPNNAYYGEEVLITIKEGYKVKNIIVKDTYGNIIPVNNNTFIMPNSPITIDVEYDETNPFTKDNLILILSISIISLVAYLYNKKQEKFLK